MVIFVKNKKMQPNLISRIELNPEILVGKPIIHGTRLSVSFILGLLANGMTISEILLEYDGLQREDILACLEFAQQNLEENQFFPIASRA